MSNWRWNFGLGPLRYSRPVSTQRKGERKPKSALGVVIALVVTFGLIYLCCWGGVAFLNSQQPS